MTDWSWTPTDEVVARSRLGDYLKSAGLSGYEEFVDRCKKDVSWFWEDIVSFLDLSWQRPFEGVSDPSEGVAWTRWFPNGGYNVSENCLDKWLEASTPAILAEDESGNTRQLSYPELAFLVEEVRDRLVSLGIGKGDRVAIYQSMTPEAVATFLAYARYGGCGRSSVFGIRR